MDTLTALQKMRELLADPKAWTKGAAARNDRGHKVDWNDPTAVCWCLAGAERRSAGPTSLPWSVLRLIAGDYTIPDFNDDPSTTHADILAALDRAINTVRLQQEAVR